MMKTQTFLSHRRSRGLPLLVLLLFGACASRSGAGGAGPSLRHEDTFEARKRLTGELVARGEWAAAFFYADQLHRERPRDPQTLILRGTIYREQGLPTEAEADLRAAIALDGRAAEAHAALGLLLDGDGRGADAERHHRRAVELAPEAPVYLNNLGFSLFLRGKNRDAVEIFQRAARLAPTNRRVRTNLGFAYGALGDLPRAARELELAGTPSEAKNNLGFVYERRGDLARAFDLYVEAIRLEPRATRPRVNLAHVAERLGRPLPDDLPSAALATERSARP
jgi:Flp pilus assembly protein TadD